MAGITQWNGHEERERGKEALPTYMVAFREHVSFDHVVAALTVPKIGRNGQIRSATCVVLKPSQQHFVDRDALHQHPRRFVLVQSLNLNLESGNRLDHVQYCIGVDFIRSARWSMELLLIDRWR